MIHPALILLVGILFLFNTPSAQQQAPLLTIDFSLDSKGDQEPGHVVIMYSLARDGREVDVRIVYDWAAQGISQRKLSKDTVAKIIELLRELPDSEERNIPQDRLVIVKFRDGNEVKLKAYHGKRLPRAMKEILELLGGIRFELRDIIEFPAVGI
jgi:hypothetical protein